MRSEVSTEPAPLGSLRRLTGVLPAPVWVLLLLLVLTATAAATVQGLVRQQQTARFEREVTTYQRELRQRFQGYAAVLVAVRAAWETVAAAQPTQPTLPAGPPLPFTARQFGQLTSGLDLNRRTPGLTALGYAPILTARERADYARRLPLLSGRSGATIYPASDLATSTPVTYLSPIGGDAGVLGFDMYTEPKRRQAIERAIRSGQPTSTTRITLLNTSPGSTDTAGLVLYLPVRQGGRTTGLLYTPLLVSAVLPSRTTAQLNTSQISLNIRLGGERLLPDIGQEAGQPLESDRFRQTETLMLAGQDWTLEFNAPAGFGSDAAANLPRLVLLLGALGSLLAALATQAQVRARQKAEQVSRSLSLSQSRLERSRTEFEAVFRAMQDTAVFTDPAGQVRFANDMLREAFGLTPFELRGAPVTDLHADPKLLPRLDALPGPHLVTTLFRRRTADLGTELFYGEMQRSSVVGESGEALGHLTVVRDVSERLEADRALRIGERRYQGVLEGMPQIVFLTDAAGKITYFNRRWWEYIGPLGADGARSASQDAGREREAGDWSADLLRAIHPDDRADFSERWQDALRSGHDLETEHRLRNADGIYRTFVTRSRAVRGTQGQVLEWVGSSTDIDDQIYAEANSRLLADVGQALSDRQAGERPTNRPADSGRPTPTPPPASWQDDSGLRRALNLMTLRFADSAALWPGQTEPGTRPDGQAPLVAGRVRRIGLDGRQESGQREIGGLNEAVAEVLRRREPAVFHGRRLHAMGLSSAILVPLSISRNEHPLGVLGLGFRQSLQDRDLELSHELGQRLTSALDNRRLLTRLHAARESLEDLNDSLEHRVAERTAQLSEANSELEAFSYSVSHDLRTPLRHIMGFADLLSRELGKPATADAGTGGVPSAKSTRYIGIITESAGRMSKLIDDLLEFSRTSRAELRRHPVDLTKLVHDARQRLLPDAGDRQVVWTIGPLPTVIGDAGLLQQVFDNLLSNALKYTRTRQQARIEISASPQGREVWLSVRDNGVGFDPEYAGKLFGVFQRLHRSDEFEGTGIGLANVRRIVSRHGGRVWAESSGPQASGDDAPGATFWVALPVEPLSLEKPSRKVQEAADQSEPGRSRQVQP